jgi:hypothetical protein
MDDYFVIVGGFWSLFQLRQSAKETQQACYVSGCIYCTVTCRIANDLASQWGFQTVLTLGLLALPQRVLRLMLFQSVC